MSSAEQAVPEVEPDVRAWLDAEQLTDVAPSAQRADLDVWIDRRLYVMAQLQERIRENGEVSARRVAMIRDHFDGENATLQRNIAWLLALLEQVARAYPYPAGTKSRRLPSGEIGRRHSGRKLRVVDEVAAMAWALEHAPDTVEEVPTLRRRLLSEWWTSTGEQPIPGCEIVEETDSPFVRAKEPTK